MTELPNGKAAFWIRVIRDVGFPIVVAMYLLWQVTPAIQAIRENTIKMNDQHFILIEQQREIIALLRATLSQRGR